MSDQRVPRRSFLTTAAATVAGAAIGSAPLRPRARRRTRRSLRLDDDSSPPPPQREIRLGVASYSLRKFPLDKALEMVKALRTPYINLKSMHVPYEKSPDELAARPQADRGRRASRSSAAARSPSTRTPTPASRSTSSTRRRAGMPAIVCTGARRPAARREVRQAVRHQGRDPQPRPRGQALPVAVRRPEAREEHGPAHGPLHRRRPHGAHRHRRREVDRSTPARACSTCT